MTLRGRVAGVVCGALVAACGGATPDDTTPADRPKDGAFDRGAAAAALNLQLRECSRPDGPTGTGHIKVVFAPEGTVVDVVIDKGPFAGTEVGDCIVARYRRIRVPPFRGPNVTVGREVRVQ